MVLSWTSWAKRKDFLFPIMSVWSSLEARRWNSKIVSILPALWLFLKIAASWGTSQQVYSSTSFHSHDNDDRFTLSTENLLLLGSISFLAVTLNHMCILSLYFIDGMVEKCNRDNYLCSGQKKKNKLLASSNIATGANFGIIICPLGICFSG